MALVNRDPAVADWVLKEVLKKSVPLADEVMLAMLNRTPQIPAWVIQEVFKKNVPFSEKVKEAINASSYPNWLINNLMKAHDKAVRNGKEPKEFEFRGFSEGADIENAISYYHNLMEYYKNAIIRNMIFSDTLGSPLGKEAAINFLKDNLCNDKEKCHLAELYMLLEDYQKVREQLNELSIIQKEEIQKYVSVKSEITTLRENGGDQLLAQDSLRQITLRTFAEDTTFYGLGRGSAINVVSQFGDYEYYEPIYDEDIPPYVPQDDNNNRQMLTQEETSKEDSKPGVMLAPNPSNGNVIVQLDENLLPQDEITKLSSAKMQLKVYTLDGKMLVNKQVQGTGAALNLELKPGIYLYTIQDNQNNILQRDKLIILNR